MNAVTKHLSILACLLFAASPSAVWASELWHLTFESNWLGPMESHIEIRHDADRVHGVSKSGAVAAIGKLPGDHSVTDGLVVFEATANPDGSFSGSFLAPWQEGALQLTICKRPDTWTSGSRSAKSQSWLRTTSICYSASISRGRMTLFPIFSSGVHTRAPRRCSRFLTVIGLVSRPPRSSSMVISLS